MGICEGPVRKTGITLGVSNRRDLIEGLDGEGVESLIWDDDVDIQRSVIARGRYHP